jgi:tetratricopeptide (TPR) repeat protein
VAVEHKLLKSLVKPSLATALAGVALVASAGSTCRSTIKGDPEKSDTRLQLAKDYLAKNQLEAAQAEADMAIAYLPTNDEAYNVRGIIHLLRGLSAERALTIDSCLTGLDAQAMRTVKDEQLAAARVDFDKATRLAPDFGEAWSNLGAIDNLLEDPERAAPSLETALANAGRLVNPALTRAHLGWTRFLAGDHVAAFTELRQALQFQPGMCVATYRLGRVYFAREEWEKAAEQFQEVSDQPACKSQEAALYLMKARLHQGLTDEAGKAREACLTLSPQSCAALECRSITGVP